MKTINMESASNRKIKHSKRDRDGDIIFDIINYSVFALFTFLCIFPIYYIFINTISANELVSKGKILFYPKDIHLGNYIEVLKIRGLARATFVSIARTVLGTGLTVFFTSFLGYAFTKNELWQRKFWYRFVIVTMYFSAGLIPGYINMKNLHLLNSFWIYVIPGIIAPYSLILIKTYIESIPQSLEESAEMDGAGYIVIFTRIILPLSKPIIATVAVFCAVGQWNTFMDTLLYIQDQKLYTLQYILYQYLNQISSIIETLRVAAQNGIEVDPSKILTPTSVRMTIAMIVIIPIVCVYPLFQKYLVKGIMIGAVKG